MVQEAIPYRMYSFSGPTGHEKMELIDNRKLAQSCLCLSGDTAAPSVDDLYRGFVRKDNARRKK